MIFLPRKTLGARCNSSPAVKVREPCRLIRCNSETDGYSPDEKKFYAMTLEKIIALSVLLMLRAFLVLDKNFWESGKMFTGIIEEVGKLKSFNGGRIEITCAKVLDDVEIGDSISTNGICLTVTDFAKDFFAADVMPETIRKTSLEEVQVGGAVNLERALKADGRFGGHIVSGHIDGTGKILNIRLEGNAVFVEVAAQLNILRQIAAKGSVALDGISLTVVDATTEKFSVSMIPHTLNVTNFKFKRVGSIVNIETDILAKYIDRLLHFKPAPIELTREILAQNGF